ncbi:ParA family protein [Cupriavidus sp. D39]|uniref:ParA family protein n=1 Tax=Cupriavidus sp. D39 TaxID=2997877 RepID=UPI00226F1B47|nr:ParA family protein [Cupriavidus sp. D39]MCY0853429.1 ParA family protein [Cupriavidus sp. D39]
MTAKVITVFNQKGGAGKTTCSLHVGAGLALRKLRILVIDADDQGTASRWIASANSANTAGKQFPGDIKNVFNFETRIHREIEKEIEDYDVIIVDCPPSAKSPVASSALLVSDIAVIPVQPTPQDMWALPKALTLVESAREKNTELMALVVANRVTRTSVASAVVEQLGNQSIPLAKVSLAQRTAYSDFTVPTGTAYGSRDKKAISEINAFVDEVTRIISL